MFLSHLLLLHLFIIVFVCLQCNPQEVIAHSNQSAANLSHEHVTRSVFQHFKLVSTYIHELGSKNDYKNMRCKNFTLAVQFKLYTFCITVEKLKESDVVRNDVKIYVLGSNEAEFKSYGLEDLNITIAHGFDVDNPLTNYVNGYVEDNKFYGTVCIEKNTFYIEPVSRFPDILKSVTINHTDLPLPNAILYKTEDVLHKSMFGDEIKTTLNTFDAKTPITTEETTKGSIKSSVIHKRAFVPESAAGRVCDLLLLADHLYLRDVAQGDVSLAIVNMLRAAEMADVIFRNADFNEDGAPDNVGVRVKYVMVLTADSPQNNLNAFETDNETVPIDGLLYLQRLAQHSALKQVCMGAGFTSRRFMSHAIGLSYTARDASQAPNSTEPLLGGICERPLFSRMNLNVLALTVTNDGGQRVPELMVMLSLAHELGHSFGSDHSNDSVSLMLPHSLTGMVNQHYRFSEYSRKKIYQVLLKKGYCLERDHHQFCGNGLVEKGEECDCGLPLDCYALDPCCIPRGRHRACHVDRARGHTCHPSQGPCCLPSCQHRDLAYLGVNCSDEVFPCPCRAGDCTCGHHGTCLGNACHSRECGRIGLAECVCPAATAARATCITCCLAPSGTCTDVAKITRTIIESGNVTIGVLRHFDVRRSEKKLENVKYERFCGPKNDCLELDFRVWVAGGVCLTHGQLGQCMDTGVCEMSPSLRGTMFPNLSVKLKSNSPPSVRIKVSVIFIYIYLLKLL